jgi:hypothetical protein
MKHVALILALCGAASAVDAATTIYRCGPGGREFSQRPCTDGTVVDGTDGRTAAQRAAALRVAEQEKRKAAELERERRAEEAKKGAAATEINGLARPADAAASAPDAARKKASKDKPKETKEAKDFVAIEPVTKKK